MVLSGELNTPTTDSCAIPTAIFSSSRGVVGKPSKVDESDFAMIVCVNQ